MIIKSAIKVIIIPIIAFKVSFSLKNIADINDDRTSDAPCSKGYIFALSRKYAAFVLKNELPKRHTAIIRMYMNILFGTEQKLMPESLFSPVFEKIKYKIMSVTAEKMYV